MGKVIIALHDGKRMEFDAGREAGAHSLADWLAARGFPLNTRCVQRGLCSGCQVVVGEGAVVVEGEEREAPGEILACRARLTGSAVIAIPARSRIEHRPQVGETFEINIPIAHQPLFEPDPGVRDRAFAVDIGTTTVVVLLVDLVTGEILSRAGAFNEQIRFGDNVLTRIDVGRDPAVVREMQEAVVAQTIAPLLERACERAECSPSRISGGAISGNTTMFHLLLGEDPTPLGIAPFTPRFIDSRRVAARDIGLATNDGALAPGTPVQLLPGIAAYIGADIVAGVYATGMVFDDKPSLLVDIGTNGEVVLQSGRRLIACATAAGPAFEGCGLCSGTRARDGAVSALRLERDPFAVRSETIGDAPVSRAEGICGSAYIDFLAEGRRHGLLNESGRFRDEVWNGLQTGMATTQDDVRTLVLSGTSPSGPRVSEVDVAVLLQAKAAIGAGIETLLKSAGITASEIAHLYLAGGFGMHLNVQHAIEIGLLPGFREDQVRVVGNTALAGAVLALIDSNTLTEMEALHSQVEVLELNLQEDFEDRYVDHLALP